VHGHHAWLPSVLDAIPIPDNEILAERMKAILKNCVGKLRCGWSEFKCARKYVGATGGVSIQSCAYNQTVSEPALYVVRE
jgi:hypothetical protein